MVVLDWKEAKVVGRASPEGIPAALVAELRTTAPGAPKRRTPMIVTECIKDPATGLLNIKHNLTRADR